MIQVRKGVFETNSSSTHSICISKKPVDVSNGVYADFHIDNYGWNQGTADAIDYLYTAILCLDGVPNGERFQKLKDILDEHGIRYSFEKPVFDNWGLDNGYIDHAYETAEFVDAVLNDEDLLMRCLFGNSVVYTGNDNEDDDDAMCWVAYDDKRFIGDWESDEDWENKDCWVHVESNHPAYDPDNYDYFFKGN